MNRRGRVGLAGQTHHEHTLHGSTAQRETLAMETVTVRGQIGEKRLATDRSRDSTAEGGQVQVD